MSDELNDRVTRLEERFNALADDIREIKDDIRYLREHLVDRQDFQYLQQRVNGIALSTAQATGKIQVLVTWVAQGGMVGATVLVILKIAEVVGFL